MYLTKTTRNLCNTDTGVFEENQNIYNEYLMKRPTKTECIENAKVSGSIVILDGTYNKALEIYSDGKYYLQSYDTIVLILDENTHTLEKTWNGYSDTTKRHINQFLTRHGLTEKQVNKDMWENWQRYNGSNLMHY